MTMFAVKGNKEKKIVDVYKDEYLKEGYTIYDDDFNLVEEPDGATISKKEFDKEIKARDEIIVDLKKQIKKLKDKK